MFDILDKKYKEIAEKAFYKRLQEENEARAKRNEAKRNEAKRNEAKRNEAKRINMNEKLEKLLENITEEELQALGDLLKSKIEQPVWFCDTPDGYKISFYRAKPQDQEFITSSIFDKHGAPLYAVCKQKAKEVKTFEEKWLTCNDCGKPIYSSHDLEINHRNCTDG